MLGGNVMSKISPSTAWILKSGKNNQAKQLAMDFINSSYFQAKYLGRANTGILLQIP